MLSTELNLRTELTPSYIKEAIATIDGAIYEHRSWPHADGLPQDIFYLSTRLSATLNVDLLVKDEKERTLLSWRDDRFSGSGWHLPGGIVRFKETLVDRVHKVAAEELRATVDVDPVPLAHNEIICPHDTRGHFYSVLYKCVVDKSYVLSNDVWGPGDAGYLEWHTEAPKNLVKVHEIYRNHI